MRGRIDTVLFRMAHKRVTCVFGTSYRPRSELPMCIREEFNMEINNQCQSLQQDISVFVNSVTTLPAAMIKTRLYTMSLQISMQTSRLHNMHDEIGVVYVMMTDTLLSVYWAEKGFSIEAAKEDLKMQGYLILSLEELAKVVEYLSDGIDSGQSAEAVEWINQYEPFLALEAKKLL